MLYYIILYYIVLYYIILYQAGAADGPEEQGEGGDQGFQGYGFHLYPCFEGILKL